MSEWKWYIHLTMQCDCILGNVGQQREYQNKTSNRSIISVSWHHALRRDALETGAVISLCTGLKSVLSSNLSHFHSRFPKLVLILFWKVACGVRVLKVRCLNQQHQHHQGNWWEMQVLSPLWNQKLWGEVSKPLCSCGLWGIHTKGGKALL